MSTGTRLILSGLIAVLIGGCDNPVFLEAPGPITLTVESNELTADGSETALVEAELPPSAPRNAPIRFTTSRGRFVAPGSDTPQVVVRAEAGRATVRLTSAGEIGTAFIAATSGGATDMAQVELVAALPDTVILSGDRSVAPADGNTAVTITALLRREEGTVSGNLEVVLTARDSADLSTIPELSRLAVASGGTATFKLTSAQVRTVLVEVHVGDQASNVVPIRFQPPS